MGESSVIDREDGRGPTRTGDPLGVNEVLWPTELRAPGQEPKASDTSPRPCCEACARGKSWQDRGGAGGSDRARPGTRSGVPAAGRGEQDFLAPGTLWDRTERERGSLAGGGAAVGQRRHGEGQGDEPEGKPQADGEPAAGS